MCDGGPHRLFAAALQPAAFTLAAMPGWQAAAGIPLAVAFSAGVTSCDFDNTRFMKKLTKWIPGRWDHEIFGHRRLLHWWGLPALLALYVSNADLGVGAWAAWAGIIGWTSHIVADFVFGQEGYGTPKGVPLLLWFGHVGVGLNSGGKAEPWLIGLACLALTWFTAGHPGLDQAGVWSALR